MNPELSAAQWMMCQNNLYVNHEYTKLDCGYLQTVKHTDH